MEIKCSDSIESGEFGVLSHGMICSVDLNFSCIQGPIFPGNVVFIVCSKETKVDDTSKCSNKIIHGWLNSTFAS